jgi:Protein of unknown function (DUF998)
VSGTAQTESGSGTAGSSRGTATVTAGATGTTGNTGLPATARWTAPRHPRGRSVLAWVLGLAGLAAYNWWLLVPLKPGLMSSPNELFSNLEVTGQPYAAPMQHADFASGVLLLAAFAVAGHSATRSGRREWLALLVFAVAGGLGGLFPEVCADGVSAVCHRLEWHFELPASQYIHMGAGIVEFAALTIALLYAWRRTRALRGRVPAIYRGLAVGALIAYPLLGAAYLFNRLGGIMEGVFFAGFTVMVITVLAERTSLSRAAALMSGSARRLPQH